MRIKATLIRPGDVAVDVVITADATARVGDVARALFLGDPKRGGQAAPEGLTLRVTDAWADAPATSPALSTPAPSTPAPAARTLERGDTIVDVGLRSGAGIELVRVDPAVAARTGAATPAALLRVLSGPDAGREFGLPFGASVVGRDREADVRLTDPLVSKRHVRVNVGSVVELVDLGSSNGIVIGGEQLARTAVAAGDVVELGDTRITVVPLQRAGAPAAASVEFVRSPRVVPRYDGRRFAAPKPPQPARTQRLPWLAIVAPVVLGLVMFAVTRQLYTVLFIALSPVLLIGSWVEQRSSARNEAKADRARFDSGLARLDVELREGADRQRAARLTAVPSLAETVVAVRSLGPLLWTHRPAHAEFLTARLGLGRVPSLDDVELPSDDSAPPEARQRVVELAARFAEVDGAPIELDLRRSGAFGVAGARAGVEGLARSVVAQLAGLHSPAELVIAAFVSPASVAAWDWLRWLPHTSSPHTPVPGDHLVDNRGAALGLLSRLEALVAERSTAGEKHEPVPAVIVVVEDDAAADRARLTRLAEDGPAVGVHVVWCAESAAALPAACRRFAVVAGGGDALPITVSDVDGGASCSAVAETLDAAGARTIGRALAPVVDAGAPVADDSDLPSSVSYLALGGTERLTDPAAIIERWRESESITPRPAPGADPLPLVRRKREGTLRALVGHAGTEPFWLDLRTQGPHALVGGTTGSGKSEFLQAWVLGMAAAYGPDRLTFLLVDYKGESGVAELKQLPHTVGVVTDLNPSLARRALTSLRAELKRREHLLARKKRKDLAALEKDGDPDAPPSLVIVVDEFAALKAEVPDFVDGVVDIAQRGRSLGLHLIMATQHPSGIITGSLRTNTNLRISLRMADEDASADILGVPLAAHFDPSVPGRTAAKSGAGRLTVFQSAYAGGYTPTVTPPPPVEVHELTFGAGAEWEVPKAVGGEQGSSDAVRMVAAITAAAAQASVPTPRRPWRDPLAPRYNLTALPGLRSDASIVFGVRDDAAGQQQPTAAYEPESDGNLVVFGAGSSGKSTALRTIAVSAGITPRGGPVHVYGLDFGAHRLRTLEGLPHVGAIVDGDDEERVVRLLRTLRDTVDERGRRYGALRVDSIGAYRKESGVHDEPRILLLVDGLGAFREAYEYTTLAPAFNAFAQIAADGRSVGVHVVMAAERPSALPPSISSSVQKRMLLRLATPDDYVLLGAPADVLGPTSPPGRGMIDGDELQLAIVGGDANTTREAREIDRLGQTMRRQGVAQAPGIRRLDEYIDLAALPPAATGLPTVGVADDDLQPFGISPKGAFLLAGTGGSGRTTALATIAAALGRDPVGRRLVLFSPRRSPLAEAAPWAVCAAGFVDVGAAADALLPEVEAGAGGDVALFIEGATEFSGSLAASSIDALVKALVRADGFAIAEGESSTWNSAWDIGGPFKAARRGLVLAPTEFDGDSLYGTGLGRIRRADFPPGRGFLIERGRARKVQLAVSAGPGGGGRPGGETDPSTLASAISTVRPAQ